MENVEKNPSDSLNNSQKTKKKKKHLFLIGILILLGGFTIIILEYSQILNFFGLFKKDTSQVIKKEVKDFGHVVKMFPLTVNLKEENGRNYLKTTITLEIVDKKWVEEVQSKMTMLSDAAITILSEKSLEDLKKPNAKDELKKELLKEFSYYFQKSQIRQILFEEFIYQ